MKPFVSIAALLLVGAGPVATKPAPKSAPTAPNWAGMVAQGPNGAYVMGNPNAKVRLIEYISYSCSHCAHFVTESSVPMKRDYIAKGLVAVEMRNAVRDQFDFTAALLARCGGAARFYGNTEKLLAAQGQWLGKAQAFLEANGAKLKKMSPVQGLQAVAQGTGMNAVMAARGFTVAQLNVCIASKPNQDRILAMTKEAFDVRKIEATPTFFVNGTELSGGAKWEVVEPALKAAIAVETKE